MLLNVMIPGTAWTLYAGALVGVPSEGAWTGSRKLHLCETVFSWTIQSYVLRPGTCLSCGSTIISQSSTPSLTDAEASLKNCLLPSVEQSLDWIMSHIISC